MQTTCQPSAEYPCLDCEAAANEHDVHPFFDRPSWQDGYGRGYQEGRLDGERLAALALRTELRSQLGTLRHDLQLHLRHDLETPGAVVATVLQMVQDGDSEGGV